jgi:hypothetical protein
MSLQASIKTAGQIFKQHDFSRTHQLRLLGFGNGVPDYVTKEFIDLGGKIYMTTATLPGKSITSFEVPYMSFTFRSPSMVSYGNGTWAITLSTPADFLAYNAICRWQANIVNEDTMCGTGFVCNDSSIQLAVLGPNCEVVRGVNIIGVFPSELSEIAYDQTTADKTTFTVTFTYQRWEPIEINESATDIETNTNDSVFQSFESKIATCIGSQCNTKTTIPRV